mmetsp:Transcript_157059/g.503921  ORF Transcript_157059/g.503921 Transcript_157059/m.503921 type:complete len:94 (+) Transcript_157059:134-415(+)
MGRSTKSRAGAASVLGLALGGALAVTSGLFNGEAFSTAAPALAQPAVPAREADMALDFDAALDDPSVAFWGEGSEELAAEDRIPPRNCGFCMG